MKIVDGDTTKELPLIPTEGGLKKSKSEPDLYVKMSDQTGQVNFDQVWDDESKKPAGLGTRSEHVGGRHHEHRRSRTKSKERSSHHRRRSRSSRRPVQPSSSGHRKRSPSRDSHRRSESHRHRTRSKSTQSGHRHSSTSHRSHSRKPEEGDSRRRSTKPSRSPRPHSKSPRPRRRSRSRESSRHRHHDSHQNDRRRSRSNVSRYSENSRLGSRRSPKPRGGSRISSTSRHSSNDRLSSSARLSSSSRVDRLSSSGRLSLSGRNNDRLSSSGRRGGKRLSSRSGGSGVAAAAKLVTSEWNESASMFSNSTDEQASSITSSTNHSLSSKIKALNNTYGSPVLSPLPVGDCPTSVGLVAGVPDQISASMHHLERKESLSSKIRRLKSDGSIGGLQRRAISSASVADKSRASRRSTKSERRPSSRRHRSGRRTRSTSRGANDRRRRESGESRRSRGHSRPSGDRQRTEERVAELSNMLGITPNKARSRSRSCKSHRKSSSRSRHERDRSKSRSQVDQMDADTVSPLSIASIVAAPDMIEFEMGLDEKLEAPCPKVHPFDNVETERRPRTSRNDCKSRPRREMGDRLRKTKSLAELSESDLLHTSTMNTNSIFRPSPSDDVSKAAKIMLFEERMQKKLEETHDDSEIAVVADNRNVILSPTYDRRASLRKQMSAPMFDTSTFDDLSSGLELPSSCKVDEANEGDAVCVQEEEVPQQETKTLFCGIRGLFGPSKEPNVVNETTDAEPDEANSADEAPSPVTAHHDAQDEAEDPHKDVSYAAEPQESHVETSEPTDAEMESLEATSPSKPAMTLPKIDYSSSSPVAARSSGETPTVDCAPQQEETTSTHQIDAIHSAADPALTSGRHECPDLVDADTRQENPVSKTLETDLVAAVPKSPLVDDEAHLAEAVCSQEEAPPAKTNVFGGITGFFAPSKKSSDGDDCADAEQREASVLSETGTPSLAEHDCEQEETSAGVDKGISHETETQESCVETSDPTETVSSIPQLDCAQAVLSQEEVPQKSNNGCDNTDAASVLSEKEKYLPEHERDEEETITGGDEVIETQASFDPAETVSSLSELDCGQVVDTQEEVPQGSNGGDDNIEAEQKEVIVLSETGTSLSEQDSVQEETIAGVNNSISHETEPQASSDPTETVSSISQLDYTQEETSTEEVLHNDVSKEIEAQKSRVEAKPAGVSKSSQETSNPSKPTVEEQIDDSSSFPVAAPSSNVDICVRQQQETATCQSEVFKNEPNPIPTCLNSVSADNLPEISVSVSLEMAPVEVALSPIKAVSRRAPVPQTEEDETVAAASRSPKHRPAKNLENETSREHQNLLPPHLGGCGLLSHSTHGAPVKPDDDFLNSDLYKRQFLRKGLSVPDLTAVPKRRRKKKKKTSKADWIKHFEEVEKPNVQGVYLASLQVERASFARGGNFLSKAVQALDTVKAAVTDMKTEQTSVTTATTDPIEIDVCQEFFRSKVSDINNFMGDDDIGANTINPPSRKRGVSVDSSVMRLQDKRNTHSEQEDRPTILGSLSRTLSRPSLFS